MTKPAKDFFVPSELAERWRVSVDKVCEFIRNGELVAIDVSRRETKKPRYRILASAVESFEAVRSVGQAQQVQPRRAVRDHSVIEYV